MKKITLVLLLLMMILVFCFSAQPADESTATSSRFCVIAAKILYPDYASYDTPTREAIAEGLTFVIRKTAHFTEYAFIGFLWYLLLSRKRHNILLSVGAVALYASSDEFHQLFVPGRSGQFRDVLIDTSGGCFGVLAAFVILCIRYCCIHKEITEKFVWKK